MTREVTTAQRQHLPEPQLSCLPSKHPQKPKRLLVWSSHRMLSRAWAVDTSYFFIIFF